MLRTVTATRYVTPLREGGSLPAIVEADDLGLYVLKFRGAGQGPLALVAELISGEIGRHLGLPVPDLVLVEVDEAFGRNERDEEVRDLVRASTGSISLSIICRDPSCSTLPQATPRMSDWLRPPSGSMPSYRTSIGRPQSESDCSGTRRCI